jgi:hypothetical protein
MTEIINAKITDVTLNYGDRGLLTAWIQLDYGGSSQGFGGYALYLPKSFKHHQLLSHAGHFITRCIQIADVESWEKIKGKTVRARCTQGSVEAIGHIVKDDWFNPSVDFKTE